VLDEYNTLDGFWVEAINTACHAWNEQLPISPQDLEGYFI
jgi:hypothetical protein